MGSLTSQEEARDGAGVGAAAPDQRLPHGEAVALDLIHLRPERDSERARHDAPRRRLGNVGAPRRVDDVRLRLRARHLASLLAAGHIARPAAEFTRGWLSEWLSNSTAENRTTRCWVGERPHHNTWCGPEGIRTPDLLNAIYTRRSARIRFDLSKTPRFSALSD